MNGFSKTDSGPAPRDGSELASRIRRAAMTAATLHLIARERERADRAAELERNEPDAARNVIHE